MTILNAAFRLRATIVEAMSVTRKEAMNFLVRSTTASTLFEHYILVHEFPEKQELAHWKKECRTFLLSLLKSTRLKTGTFKKEDFIRILWGNHAETLDDVQSSVANILIVEGLSNKDIDKILNALDWHRISKDYKQWLSNWYDHYHDVHSKYKYTLPISLF